MLNNVCIVDNNNTYSQLDSKLVLTSEILHIYTPLEKGHYILAICNILSIADKGNIKEEFFGGPD